MKYLPEGTTKYLMFHPTEIQRNVQRFSDGGPIVNVAEVFEDGRVEYHDGFSILAEGPIGMQYEQHNKVIDYYDPYGNRRTPMRAAFYTTSAVALGESRDEVLSITTKPKSAAKKPTAKTEE